MCHQAPPALDWLIVRSGWTGKQLAEEVGVSPTWLSNIRRGHVTPSPELRARIAAALRLPERELFEVER